MVGCFSFRSVDVSGPSIKTKKFITGSCYEGDLTPGKGMHGVGVYTFPNGNPMFPF